MKNDNVILFPKGKKDNSPPQTLDEIFDKITRIREEHAENTIQEIAPQILNILASMGIDIEAREQQTLNAMLIECVRAHLHKTLKIHHPFHDVADQFFVYREDESGVMYSFSPDVFDTEEDEKE
jgi:hypothetical protein